MMLIFYEEFCEWIKDFFNINYGINVYFYKNYLRNKQEMYKRKDFKMFDIN